MSIGNKETIKKCIKKIETYTEILLENMLEDKRLKHLPTNNIVSSIKLIKSSITNTKDLVFQSNEYFYNEDKKGDK